MWEVCCLVLLRLLHVWLLADDFWNVHFLKPPILIRVAGEMESCMYVNITHVQLFIFKTAVHTWNESWNYNKILHNVASSFLIFPLFFSTLCRWKTAGVMCFSTLLCKSHVKILLKLFIVWCVLYIHFIWLYQQR